MRRLPIAALFLCSAYAAGPRSPLDETQLEAVHAQRVEWMKTRVGGPPLGIYQDFRAVFTHSRAAHKSVLKAAEDSGVQVVLSDAAQAPSLESGVLFLTAPEKGLQEIYHRSAEDPAALQTLRRRIKQYPEEAFGAGTNAQGDFLGAWDAEIKGGSDTAFAWSDVDPNLSAAVAFRNTSTHILARELTEAAILASLQQGHAYVAHDWLCDPTGFTFNASNYLGSFEMGDTVPTGLVAGSATLQAFLPLPARIKLIHNGAAVAEARDSKISYVVKEQGAYRIEAWLTVAGEERPWIFSNPIYVRGNAAIAVPPANTPAGVELHGDITYVQGGAADEAKHKLDLFLPKGRTNFPMMMFVHGGSWRTGDRSLYRALGNYFAQAGIGVAIPSYRLMPNYPHPAQIEDVAAAFAWMHDNAPKYGGDVKRLYVSGHSAGGHLVALLALDPQYLQKHGLAISTIRGVVAMSGVYDVRNTPEYLDPGDKAQASPLLFVRNGTPPFLISYCQWDYLGLPRQAADFGAALKKSFDDTRVIYIPGETHVSEIVSAVKDGAPLSRAILSFIQ
ncbi:MAG TPA: alpha/beta hydrolase fold domain-containing protein [Bryobacteraceae bacterium]